MKQIHRCLSMFLALCLTIGLVAVSAQAAKKPPKLSKTKLTLTVGASKTLKVSPKPAKIIWKSKNPQIATVKKGKVLAKKPGAVKITAKVGKKTLTCKVTVKAKPVKPTVAPSATPTVAPSATPTVAPSATPTVAPSATPTVAPSATPTVAPSATPTVAPSATPTVAPSATPTVAPSATPTVAPSATPTVAPSATPTVAPSATPTVAPTTETTVAPVVRSFEAIVSQTKQAPLLDIFETKAELNAFVAAYAADPDHTVTMEHGREVFGLRDLTAAADVYDEAVFDDHRVALVRLTSNFVFKDCTLRELTRAEDDRGVICLDVWSENAVSAYGVNGSSPWAQGRFVLVSVDRAYVSPFTVQVEEQTSIDGVTSLDVYETSGWGKNTAQMISSAEELASVVRKFDTSRYTDDWFAQNVLVIASVYATDGHRVTLTGLTFDADATTIHAENAPIGNGASWGTMELIHFVIGVERDKLQNSDFKVDVVQVTIPTPTPTVMPSITPTTEPSPTTTPIPSTTPVTTPIPAIDIPETLRAVLTWDDATLDLDLHFFYDKGDSAVHVFYENPAYDEDLTAWLENDPVEVISVQNLIPGQTVSLYVHNYTNRSNNASTALANSGAVIALYDGEIPLATPGGVPLVFTVPDNAGTWWMALDITVLDNGKMDIVPIRLLA